MNTSQRRSISARATGFRFGVISLLVITFCFVLVNQMAKGSEVGAWRWIESVMLALFVLAAQRHYFLRTQQLSFADRFSISAWLGLVSGLGGAILRYFYYTQLDDSQLSHYRDSIIDGRQMTKEHADQAADLLSIMINPGVASVAFFIWSLMLSILAGIIVGIFIKKLFKNKPIT